MKNIVINFIKQEKKLFYTYSILFIIQFIGLSLGIYLYTEELGISKLERINSLIFGVLNFCTILLIPAPYYEYTYLYSPMTLVNFIYLFTYLLIYLFTYLLIYLLI